MNDPFRGYDAWKTSGPPENDSDDAFEIYVEKYGDKALKAIVASMVESGMPDRYAQDFGAYIESIFDWDEIMEWGNKLGAVPSLDRFRDGGEE